MVLWTSPKKMSTFEKNIGRANPQKWHPYIPACFLLDLYGFHVGKYIPYVFWWVLETTVNWACFFRFFQVSRSTTSGVGFFWWHLALWCNGTFRGTTTARADGSGDFTRVLGPQMVAFSEGTSPAISGKSRWRWNIRKNWPDKMKYLGGWFLVWKTYKDGKVSR